MLSGTDYFVFSILIGGGISIARFPKIRWEYYPFIYVIWLACINELLGAGLVLTNHYNVIPNNIYSIIEGLLLLWFFDRLGAFRRMRVLRYILVILFIAIWITDNFIIHNDFGRYFNSYFNIFCSFTLVLLAITTINNILISEREVIKNPAFLICIAIVIFFTYMVLVESFWIYGMQSSTSFTNNVFSILAWINLFCNLIYAVAILWMRKKKEFTLQF